MAVGKGEGKRLKAEGWRLKVKAGKLEQIGGLTLRAAC
jgi:hypothetical protein